MILSRDQNYKVGDLVNNTKGAIHKNEPAIVLKVHENEGFYSRCLIEYQDPNSITVDGRKVQNWVSGHFFISGFILLSSTIAATFLSRTNTVVV